MEIGDAVRILEGMKAGEAGTIEGTAVHEGRATVFVLVDGDTLSTLLFADAVEVTLTADDREAQEELALLDVAHEEREERFYEEGF